MEETTNYNLNVPVLSDAPPDVTKLSENFTSLDSVLKSQADAIAARLPLAGGTMSGTISSSAEKVINAIGISSGFHRDIEFNAEGGRVGYVRAENGATLHKVSLNAVNFSDVAAAAIAVEVDSVGNVSATAPTPVSGDSSNKIATTAFVKAVIRDFVYPVGSIICNAETWDPNERLGGTWVKISEGRCLLAAGTNYPVKSTGGSADAIIPYHTHTFTGSAVATGTQSANHTHSFSGTTSSNGAHTHSNQMCSGDSGTGYCTDGNDPNGKYTNTSSAGNHAHTYSGNTSSNSANHTHTVTAKGSNSYAGNSGNTRGANLPPYFAVYIWRRTA